MGLNRVLCVLEVDWLGGHHCTSEQRTSKIMLADDVQYAS